MLHWLHIVVVLIVVILVLVELFQEKKWDIQIALVMIVIPLILRILHIK